MVKNYKRREEKQQKRNRTIIGIIITVLMVGSTLGIFMDGGNSSQDNEFVNKDGQKFNFVYDNGKYHTKINDKTLSFYFHPLEAEQLNISKQIIDYFLYMPAFYITFDPESPDISAIEQARFDLTNNFMEFNKYILPGITKNSTIYKLNIITCENATQSMPVIMFKSSNTTKAYVNDSCIIFEGGRSDFYKFRDFVTYSLYDVI